VICDGVFRPCGPQIVCSVECREEHRARRAQEAIAAYHRNKQPCRPRLCTACNKEFQPEVGHKKVCSEECRLALRREREIGPARERNRANPEPRRMYSRRHRAKHPEAHRQRTNDWRAANPEHVAAYRYEYGIKNYKRLLERKVERRIEEKAAVRAYRKLVGQSPDDWKNAHLILKLLKTELVL
jgi:hypothetical protein